MRVSGLLCRIFSVVMVVFFSLGGLELNLYVWCEQCWLGLVDILQDCVGVVDDLLIVGCLRWIYCVEFVGEGD